jgi:hypothetical protein
MGSAAGRTSRVVGFVVYKPASPAAINGAQGELPQIFGSPLRKKRHIRLGAGCGSASTQVASEREYACEKAHARRARKSFSRDPQTVLPAEKEFGRRIGRPRPASVIQCAVGEATGRVCVEAARPERERRTRVAAAARCQPNSSFRAVVRHRHGVPGGAEISTR